MVFRSIFTLLAILLLNGCKQQNIEDSSDPNFLVTQGSESRIDAIKPHLSLVESIILRYTNSQHIPGVGYAVILNGQTIKSGYAGWADIDNKTAVFNHTAFRIASMTKSFTTMAILMLRDQGKLSLDDPASKYLPEMADMPYLTTDAPAITLRHLMTHMAGFPEDNPYGDRQLGDTDEELKKLLSDGPSFSNIPGISYEYSNLGISILGLIIKKISGKSYQDYISENIFQPLGMKHTYWDYSKIPGKELAHGYNWINNNWQEEELLHDGSWAAMGGLITTIEDFQKYMRLHLGAWPPRNGEENKLIKRSSIREMHQMWNLDGINSRYSFPSGRACPIVSGYGFGLRVTKDCEGRVFIGHGGGLPGFGSHWLIMPQYGLGIAIFSNRTYAGWGSINMQILDTLVHLSGINPDKPTPSPILEQRKNELVKFLPHWNEAEASEIFAENFFPDFPIDDLRKKTQELFKNAGAVTRISPMNPWNNLRGEFDIITERDTIRVFFTLSPETVPKIQDFRIWSLKSQ